MAVRIRLMRLGKIRNPQYRIVVADQRKKRDGRAIEEIGIYHPKEEPSRIEVNSERAQYWLSVGAQPSDPVRRLLELTGDWQKYKGLPAPEPLKMAEPKADKHAAYEAEAKALLADEEKKATTEKKKPAKKTTKAKAEDKTKAEPKSDKTKPDNKPDKAKTDKAKPEAKADQKADEKAGAESKAKSGSKSKPKTEEKAGADSGAES